MTNQITISACYTCLATGVVDLSPKTWDDVKEWYIKWDTLFVLFDGDKDMKKFPIDSDASEDIDWKRPSGVDVYAGSFEFEEHLHFG